MPVPKRRKAFTEENFIELFLILPVLLKVCMFSRNGLNKIKFDFSLIKEVYRRQSRAEIIAP